jgi:hypothetical protein
MKTLNSKIGQSKTDRQDVTNERPPTENMKTRIDEKMASRSFAEKYAFFGYGEMQITTILVIFLIFAYLIRVNLVSEEKTSFQTIFVMTVYIFTLLFSVKTAFARLCEYSELREQKQRDIYEQEIKNTDRIIELEADMSLTEEA